jgi:hypothetical protein
MLVYVAIGEIRVSGEGGYLCGRRGRGWGGDVVGVLGVGGGGKG